MNPSVGRIVHYTNLGDAEGKYPPQAQAAIITAIYDEIPPLGGAGETTFKRVDSGLPQDAKVSSTKVDLLILYPTGQFSMQKVPFSEQPLTRGHWNWPPRA